MALEYYKLLEESGLKFLATKNQLNSASNLRFSIRCSDEKQVSKLVKALKKNNIYVSDRWYRKAVDCGSFECKSTYQKASCPNAELLATQVINLPTHREMNLKKVHRICKVINKALGK